MNEFISMVLRELSSALWQALAVTILAAGAIVFAYHRHKRRYQGEQPFPWRKTIFIFLLVGYLSVVGYATFSRLSGSGASGYSFHLFRAWREAWNNFSVTGWLNVLLNIAMFIPLGILLPLLRPDCQKWNRMLPGGFLTSLAIETLQLFSGRGIFDVDDLLNNTLGAMLGYFLLMTVLRLKEKRFKGAAGYGVLVLIPLLAISDVFITYDTLEYGNLPGAATYRVNTHAITWNLDCSLPDVPDTVPIYFLKPPTQAESDTLRDTFAAALGVEFERTDYYDESIMYMDQQGDGPCAHFLTVQRIDGSYEYSCLPSSYDYILPETAETDRASIEASLAKFGLTVPENAEFSYLHSGIHLFTADRAESGDTLIDGKLSCVYHQDGTVSEIHNSLVSYTYHAVEPIITPQKAYSLLCQGDFGDSQGHFSRYRIRTVTVTGCTLSYAPDTKGFRQPVYLFDLTFDNGFSTTVMIPALASL